MRVNVAAVLLVLMLALPGSAAAVSLSLSVTVTDLGEPSAFLVSFSIPIVINAPTLVTASLSGTLTDGGTDGVSIAPISGALDSDGDGILEILVATVNSFTVNLGVDVGPASTTAGAYGPFSAGPQAYLGPLAPTTLDLTLSFRLSGGGDSASFNGIVTLVEVAAVSEPATVWLLMSGAAVIVLRRQHRGKDALKKES
jgi:hypothetical protein